MRAEFGPAPALRTAPSVSIIVLNLDGLKHLERLLPALATVTDYPDFELIVVDNGSQDGSREYLRSVQMPYPVVPIFNEENESFSDANNRGVDASTAELLLFLNNDIEPFEPGWLRESVACLDRQGGAVGSVLLHGRKNPSAAGSGYMVQHRGIRFYDAGGWARGRNLDDGDDLFDERLGVDVRCPAVTAACLLVSRETFDSVGGFTTGFRYGTEDIDLCLKLTAAGHPVTCAGRSVLFHHESATQAVVSSHLIRDNRLNNQRLFTERWGAQISRDFRLDRLDARGFWAPARPPHIAITVTSRDPADGYGDLYTASELGSALEELGWRVSYVERVHDAWYSLPDGLDYLLVLLDSYDLTRVSAGVVTIAWIRNWTERWLAQPWFHRYNIVLASSSESGKMAGRQAGKHAHLFPLATNPERFRPGEHGTRDGAVFTGNRWDRRRTIEDAAEGLDRYFRIYGKGWEDTKLAAFGHGMARYDELPEIYGSAAIVVDDAASHTLPYGSVNSRVFDALACGALVITNGERGVRELFDTDFPTWRSGEDVVQQIHEYRDNAKQREKLAERYRSVVLDRHTYAHRAAALSDLVRGYWEQLRFVFKIGAPDWDRAPWWGDLYFARGVQRQLEGRGHACLIQVLEEWDDIAGLEYDVVVHLKGLSEYHPKPGQLNVLWCISHPEKVTAEECDRYDLVLVASERFAETLRTRTTTPVHVLQQATDPAVFAPTLDLEAQHDLAFVGNSRKVMRRILADLLPTDLDLAVWGNDWDGLIDPRHVRGVHISNHEVAGVYSSASIVLNDHWDDMRDHGFVSNRLYDALACGACVVSDYLPEIDELFSGAVVTYRTREDLANVIETLRCDSDLRAELGQRGRAIVLGRDTFAHRVPELLGLVEQRLRELDFPLRVEPSTVEA